MESRNTAIRPASMTSIGGTITVPPAEVIAAAASSALSTLMYWFQYGGPGFICGPSPATEWPSMLAMR